jgi:hypothetical protein
MNYRANVGQALSRTKVIDLHTHLYPPTFGSPLTGDQNGLMLYGIDELLNFHYIAAEYFRVSDVTPADHFKLSPWMQAERIWRALFVERSPNSAACRPTPSNR